MTEPTDMIDSGSETPEEPRRPTPSAQAASRARRIGGRPLPGPRTEPGSDEPTSLNLTKAAAGEAPAAQSPTETKPAKSPKPAKGAKPARQPLDIATVQRRIALLGKSLAIAGTVAVVAVLGVGLWLSHGVWWAKTSVNAKRTETSQQVLAAAKSCTAAILSYDYRKLPANEKTGQACATGQLKTDYTKLMDTTVKTIAPQSQAVQVFQVAKAGIVSVSPDGKQWVVLVYGQESVTSTSTTAGPRLDISSASVTLDKVGNTWLVGNMATTGS